MSGPIESTDASKRASPKTPAKRLYWLIREHLRLSWLQAAEDLGATHTAVRNWATGLVIPDEFSKRAIAEWSGAHESPPRRTAIFEHEWPTPKAQVKRLAAVKPFTPGADPTLATP